ncbi:MAG TPA: FMNH2-dependent alkanesulfonate monooxygenase [Opitutaceae bacterium]
MEINWFIPLHGDGRYLSSARGARPTSLDYLTQVAKAVDTLGYSGALLPIGRTCEDAWVAGAALIAATQRMKFIVALRPGNVSPTLAARMAATFERLSGGRLAINAVSGADRRELAGDGVYLEHDQRYELTGEFLEVWRQIMAGEKVSFHGKHLNIDDASLMFPPQTMVPEVYFGGSSASAIDVAAKHADVYLSFGEPLELAKEKLARVRAQAAAEGRTVRFGIRFHVIVRETEAEAWGEAERLISDVKPEAIAKAQENLSKYESEGQARMSALHRGDRSRLLVGPNLWAGVGLVRGYAATALVGDPDSIAARMREYEAVGFDTFILSGYPHLEEAYRFAELVFPKLGYSPEQRSVRGEVLAHHSH